MILWYSSTFVPTIKADVQSRHVGRNNATVFDETLVLVGASMNTGNGATRARSTGVEVRVRTAGSRRVTVDDE